MKKILILFLLLLVVGCQSNTYEDTYYLTYFYVEDCLNCQYFKKNVLPVIKKEFGKHIKIKAYDMDYEKTFD